MDQVDAAAHRLNVAGEPWNDPQHPLRADVWCAKCTRPASHDVDVQIDARVERQALCDLHYYALMRATKAR